MKLVKQPQRIFDGIRKVVLREDLMALTGDLCQSMVLGQMIYWTKTLDKINDWLFEENKRLAESDMPQHDYNYGWIWKSAREMRADLFNAFSEDSIQRAFTALTSKGVLMKRNNPYLRYDRKLHYRVDLVLLRRLLRECGFEMSDFKLISIPQEAVSIPHGAECTPHSAGAITEISKESITERTPIVPLEGDSNLSPNEQLGLPQGATAQGSESDDSNSRPPQHEKANKVRGSRKSPPTKKPVLLADDAYFAKLAEIYPHLDMEKESKAMDAWLLSRPHRPKSQAFAANWINRAAERYAEKNNKDNTPRLPNGEIDWANVKPNE
jgi:hypothetical protein